jgi:hypothetical protein
MPGAAVLSDCLCLPIQGFVPHSGFPSATSPTVGTPARHTGLALVCQLLR